MMLSTGPALFAAPGPTPLPPEVLKAMQAPAMDIWEGEAVEVTDQMLAGLGRIFGAAGPVYLHIGNGHAGWEAALANLFSPGERILALEAGGYARNWGRMAEALGLEVETLIAPEGEGLDPEAIVERLRADRGRSIKAVMAIHVDTNSSVTTDPAAIRSALDRAGHPALLMIDAIASLGCAPFRMDAWGVDVSVAASQKGLMAPPGLAYVAAGPRALEAHRSARLRTRYWDWSLREAGPLYTKFCGTPPTHLLLAQLAALQVLEAEGLEAAFARHRALAAATRAAAAAWAEGGAIGFVARDPAVRAETLTTLRFTDGRDSAALRALTRDGLGATLGVGLGPEGAQRFRIAHMGYCNGASLLGVLGSVETALTRLDVPRGEGVAAAVRSLAGAIGVPEDAGS